MGGEELIYQYLGFATGVLQAYQFPGVLIHVIYQSQFNPKHNEVQLKCFGSILIAFTQEGRHIQIVRVDPGGELIGIGWLSTIRGFLCVFPFTDVW